MFFMRRRVEEDLERIRVANLTPEKAEAERKKAESARLAAKSERLTVKDIIAMIIAVFSLVLPYLLVFIAAVGLILFLLFGL